ncbi:hypothetical protein KW786_01835 [Candidatus Parcubacteria bacterium]|nr:hypothetical protein [Candidatus Parcubacteria bacterium]
MRRSIEQHIQSYYPRQYHCVINGGKLIDDWANVADHCFTQAVAVEVLGEALGLPPDNTTMLTRVAACHDWAKRLERKPEDFSDGEKEEAQKLFQATHTPQLLIEALSPAFLVRATTGKATFLELLQFLLDDMTMGEKIVPVDDRVQEVRARNPNPAPEVEQQLGRPFWDVELEVAHRVESMVQSILGARYIAYDSIAQLINHGIDQRFPN